jgi:Haem-binding domain
LTVPREVATILDRSCRDCHTNETRWPWYSHVAPASLLLSHDVREGRDLLNFSEWSDYDTETADEQLTEICKEVREGEMSLRPHTWLHPEAKLSSRDVEVLCAWTEKARAEVRLGG